jgi:hypothetical protein
LYRAVPSLAWSIRTLKENLAWVRAYETIEELHQALPTFKVTFDTTPNGRGSSRQPDLDSSIFSPSQKRYRVQSGIPETAGGTSRIRWFTHQGQLGNILCTKRRRLNVTWVHIWKLYGSNEALKGAWRIQ